MARVALVPHPVLGPSMAGPGWRSWEMGRALSRTHAVTLLAPPGSTLPGAAPPGLALEVVDPARVAPRLPEYDAVVTQGAFVSPARDGRALSRTRLVLDLYDPLPVELPQHYAAGREAPGPAEERRYAWNMRRLGYLLRRADAVLVANERQRDLVVGMLLAGGDMRAGELVRDPDLDGRLLTVPCGAPDLPGTPLPAAGWPLAWGGGTWTWFDTDLALLLAAELHAADPRYRLLVPDAPPGPEARLARASSMTTRAREAGLVGGAVALTPWRDRDAYLRELAGCRVGLSLARGGLEARFAHRTRVLDYLAAGLPCVLTRGDALAEAGAREGWAREVAPGDLEGAREAVQELAEDGEPREAARAAAQEGARARSWARAVSPLDQWLESAPPPRRKPRWELSLLGHQLRRFL